MYEDSYDIVEQIKADKDKYGFKQSASGRETLRKLTRHIEGLQLNDPTKKSVYKENHEAPIAKLCRGEDYTVPQEVLVKCGIISNTPLVVKGADVVAAREKVQLYFMQDKITAQQVEQIQQAKINGATVADHKKLEQLASYMLVVGEAQQYNEVDGSVIPASDLPNRKRVLYYGAFPKLTGNSLDCKMFVSNGHALKNVEELKEKFKDIIKMYCFVAAQRGEGLDIVTPDAFFRGLSMFNEQDKAKAVFIDAAIEVMQDINHNEKFDGFKGLFLHEEGLPKISRLYSNTGDASSPNRVALEQKLGFRVAECIMGEPLGKVGNGAIFSRANKAKEENDTRESCGTIQAVFNSPRLLDMANYTKITPDFTIQESAEHQQYIEQDVLVDSIIGV